jgi:hypothetical protein
VALCVIEVPAIAGESRAVTAWKETRPVVARSVLLLAAGALLRYLMGRAAKAAIGRALESGSRGLALRRFVPFLGDTAPERQGGEEVELLWYRRVRR